MVQVVELHAQRIIFRRVLHRNHLALQALHAIADRELRKGRQHNHQYDDKRCGRREAGKVARPR